MKVLKAMRHIRYVDQEVDLAEILAAQGINAPELAGQTKTVRKMEGYTYQPGEDYDPIACGMLGRTVVRMVLNGTLDAEGMPAELAEDLAAAVEAIKAKAQTEE